MVRSHRHSSFSLEFGNYIRGLDAESFPEPSESVLKMPLWVEHVADRQVLLFQIIRNHLVEVRELMQNIKLVI